MTNHSLKLLMIVIAVVREVDNLLIILRLHTDSDESMIDPFY